MTAFWEWLELLPLSARIGESWWFPLLESLHVLTAMFMVGSILWVDLRLLGAAGDRYPLRRFAAGLLSWTWASFVIASITGFGMFMTRASWYVMNRAFQIKLLLLALAAINMTLFHLWGRRTIAQWDTAKPNGSARFAGALSLLIWAGVTLAGRWTGHLS